MGVPYVPNLMSVITATNVVSEILKERAFASTNASNKIGKFNVMSWESSIIASFTFCFWYGRSWMKNMSTYSRPYVETSNEERYNV